MTVREYAHRFETGSAFTLFDTVGTAVQDVKPHFTPTWTAVSVPKRAGRDDAVWMDHNGNVTVK